MWHGARGRHLVGQSAAIRLADVGQVFDIFIFIRSETNICINLVMVYLRGFAKKKIQKIKDYYGSGWVQVSIGFFFENPHKIALNQIFWSSIPCVFCLYIHC